MSNLTGERLDGRYLLEDLVGEGGMADVYRAQDLKEHRTVGVKILRDELRDNEELVRRFKNESRAISVLNHDNIVKVYDVSVNDKLQYIVMEYIDGITLKEYIEQRGEPLTYKETIHFITQILKALQHAHDKGIVHRDIKPQNIMLMESGTLKVMDFGIARLARSESHTVSDQAIGSVHYISPEQAKGESTDPRADLYSVGIMMYEMLSGRLPFESDNAVAIAVAQISDDAVPLQRVNPSVPPGLAEITMKAMTKDPRFRYQSALEMLRDVDEFKRDPSVKFDYDYLQGNSPERTINRVVNGNKRPGGRAPQKRGGKVGKNGKKKKRIGLVVPIALGVTIAVVGVCAYLIYTMFTSSGNPLFTNYEDVELPNFVGDKIEDVEALMKSDSRYKHLRLEIDNTEYNPGIEAGQVISQNPTSSDDNPKMVKANQKIYLKVSRGIEEFTVTDLAGLSRKEAIQQVLEWGLRPYAKPEVSDTVEPGTVIRTDPAAGSVTDNAPGRVFTIYVSSRKGDYMRTVPSIVGMDQSNAQLVVLAQGFNFGPVKEVYDATAPAGQVISQTPEAGESRSMGTMIYATVSKGPEPPSSSSEPPKPEDTNVKVPGVTGAAANSGKKTLEAAGFKVSVQNAYSDTVAKDIIINQSPGKDSMLPKGSTVTITVSLGPEPVDPPDPPSSSLPDPSGSTG